MQVNKVSPVGNVQHVNVLPIRPNNDFKSVLEQEVKFSKHANTRLNDRDINLSTEQMERLENGINNARQKGIRDSLVIVDNIALVVNVNSGTVITALEKEQRNVFTNIDGAVIA